MGKARALNVFQRITQLEKGLEKIDRRLARITNLLTDVSQKLCHLIRQMREDRLRLRAD